VGLLVNVKNAAMQTGLSVTELRRGAKAHEYPCLFVGVAGKKLMFDIVELQEYLSKTTASNIRDGPPEQEQISEKIRRIK